jgi:hypothetical protein
MESLNNEASEAVKTTVVEYGVEPSRVAETAIEPILSAI